MRLSREGLIAGPSSGEALHGLLEYISQLKKVAGLAQLRNETTGEISCVFTCCDLPYQYLPAYYQKLGADEFPRIQNEVSPFKPGKPLELRANMSRYLDPFAL